MQFRKASLIAAFAAAAAVSVVAPQQAQAQQQQVAQATVGNLIAALNNINAQIRALENVDVDLNRVRVVNVQDILNDANVQAFNNALNRNNVEVITLRNSLNDNEVIKNVLNNANVAVSDVVAVNVLSGGDVVIFYQPQAE